MRNREQRRRRIDELFSEHVESFKYIEMNKLSDDSVMFEDWTINWHFAPVEEGQLYFWERDKDLWLKSAYKFVIDGTMYIVRSNINLDETAEIMKAYHEAKKNGNISVYRLD